MWVCAAEFDRNKMCVIAVTFVSTMTNQTVIESIREGNVFRIDIARSKVDVTIFLATPN